ncbi:MULTISPECIES: hypothetical protein [Pontibacillus]|uniref:Holin n=1 Tax=Pontibacillus chungwhensis TaxID=265426 RepID=A0ABY8V611_9BACI|nr:MULTISPECIES: hypothetical protein [Pontibacillus]MCD5326152.1 hypothetical protein [Pontibacillus sp. HN14]WIG00290.1 hypothetical protein QNI29_21020 [Pontibacillus chungwhensis]
MWGDGMEELNLLNQLGLEGQHIVFILVVAVFSKLLVDVLKNSFSIRKNLLPLVGVGVGVGLSVVFSLLPIVEIGVVIACVYGLIAGLLTPGIHELIKKRFGKTKNEGKGDVV